jgi:hypothetical protein
MTVIDAADEACAASGQVMGFITQVNPLEEFQLLGLAHPAGIGQ